MQSYAMLRHYMPCCAVLCYAFQCYAVLLRDDMLRSAMIYVAMLHYAWHCKAMHCVAPHCIVLRMYAFSKTNIRTPNWVRSKTMFNASRTKTEVGELNRVCDQ